MRGRRFCSIRMKVGVDLAWDPYDKAVPGDSGVLFKSLGAMDCATSYALCNYSVELQKGNKQRIVRND